MKLFWVELQSFGDIIELDENGSGALKVPEKKNKTKKNQLMSNVSFQKPWPGDFR